MKPTNIIPTLAALALGITSSHGAITVVNSNTGVNGFVNTNPAATNPFSFDAGATADMLVVALSSELGGNVSGFGINITYDGFALTEAYATDGPVARIYYLDLGSTTYSGGNADLVVDLSNWGTRNGLGIGVASINGDLAPGEILGLHSVSSTGAVSTVLDTTVDDAFVMVSFNANNANGSVSVDSPLTQIYARPNIGSARGAAGYELDVDAGSHTYSWTVPSDPRRVTAASFVVVPAPTVIPEPSVALLGCLGALGLLRRRRFED